MLHRLPVYQALVRIGFLEPLAYRLFPFMMLVSYPIILSGNYFLYQALYASRGGSPIAGLTIDQAITYMLVAWTVRSFYKIPIARIIGERVKSGDIAMDLMKPVNLFGFYLCQGIGRGFHRLIFIAVPLTLLILLTGKVELPSAWDRWGLFLLSAVGGFLLNAALSYLTGLLAFLFEYHDGFDWMIDVTAKLLGGLMLPLSFFPDAVQPLLKASPFAGLYYQPATIFLGQQSSAETLFALQVQWGWVVGLSLLAHMLLLFGRRKLLVQGG
ncbi:MAG: hypothetical protein GEEBNDBF_00186 [bacterium]|nr:hypothetical protein [bacterium]